MSNNKQLKEFVLNQVDHKGISEFIEELIEKKNIGIKCSKQPCNLMSMEYAKILELAIFSDENVAIDIINEGLITDIVCWGIQSIDKREIQFESWILLRQILEIWHKLKKKSGKSSNESQQQSNDFNLQDSIMNYMQQQFELGIIRLFSKEETEICVQLLAGIRNSLKCAVFEAKKIVSSLSSYEIINTIISPQYTIRQQQQQQQYRQQQEQLQRQQSYNSSSLIIFSPWSLPQDDFSDYSSLPYPQKQSNSYNYNNQYDLKLYLDINPFQSNNQQSSSFSPKLNQLFNQQLNNRLQIILLIFKMGNIMNRNVVRSVINSDIKVQIAQLCTFQGIDQKQQEKNQNENQQELNRELQQIALALTAHYLSPDDNNGAKLATVIILENIKEKDQKLKQILNQLQIEINQIQKEQKMEENNTKEGKKILIDLKENEKLQQKKKNKQKKREKQKLQEDQIIEQDDQQILIDSNFMKLKLKEEQIEMQYLQRIISQFNQFDQDEEEQIIRIQQILQIINGNWEQNQINEQNEEKLEQKELELKQTIEKDNLEIFREKWANYEANQIQENKQEQYNDDQNQNNTSLNKPRNKKQKKQNNKEITHELKQGKQNEQEKEKEKEFKQDIEKEKLEEEEQEYLFVELIRLGIGKEICDMIQNMEQRQAILLQIEEEIKKINKKNENQRELNKTGIENEIMRKLEELQENENHRKKYLENITQRWINKFERIIRNKYQQQNHSQSQNEAFKPILQFGRNDIILSKKQMMKIQTIQAPAKAQKENVGLFGKLNQQLQFLQKQEQQQTFNSQTLSKILNAYNANAVGYIGGNQIYLQSIQSEPITNTEIMNQQGSGTASNQIQSIVNQQQNVQSSPLTHTLNEQNIFHLHVDIFVLILKCLMFGGNWSKDAVSNINQIIQVIQTGKNKNQEKQFKQQQENEEQQENYLLNIRELNQLQIFKSFDISYMNQMIEELIRFEECEQTNEMKMAKQYVSNEYVQRQQEQIINFEKSQTEQYEIPALILHLYNFNSYPSIIDISNQRNSKVINLLSTPQLQQHQSQVQQQIWKYQNPRSEIRTAAKILLDELALECVKMKKLDEDGGKQELIEKQNMLQISEGKMIRYLNIYSALFLQQKEVDGLISNFLPVIISIIQRNLQYKHNEQLFEEIFKTLEILRLSLITRQDNQYNVELQFFQDALMYQTEFAFQLLDIALKQVQESDKIQTSNSIIRMTFTSFDLICILLQYNIIKYQSSNSNYNYGHYNSHNQNQQQNQQQISSNKLRYDQKLYQTIIQILSIKEETDRKQMNIEGFNIIVSYALQVFKQMIENNKNFVKIVAIDVQFAKIFVACLKRSLINDAFAVNSITQIQPSQDKSMTAMFVQFMNVLYEIQQCGCQSYPIVLIKNRLFIRNLAMRMSVAGGKESESYIVNQSLSHLLSCVYQVNDELNALRATLYLPKMMIEDLETEGFGDEIEALKVNKEEDHYITQSAIAIKDAFFNLYRAPPDQVAGIPGQQLINQRFIIVGLVGGSGW